MEVSVSRPLRDIDPSTSTAEYAMSWQFGLSRFIHGFVRGDETSRLADRLTDPQRPRSKPTAWAIASAISVEREELLLPALVAAVLDVEGSCGAWPPRRVKALLELAGLDRITGGMHLRGPNFPPSFHCGPRSRGLRQTVLLEGLAALDEGLLAETGLSFEMLSPPQRGVVLGAFERGELGCMRDDAERFMDCLVETVTFAYLNVELPAGYDANRVPRQVAGVRQMWRTWKATPRR